eukprot:1194553-Prorocentrum_minimum.AAC.5
MSWRSDSEQGDLDELEERFGGVRVAIWSWAGGVIWRSDLDELEERFGGVGGAIWRGEHLKGNKGKGGGVRGGVHLQNVPVYFGRAQRRRLQAEEVLEVRP